MSTEADTVQMPCRKLKPVNCIADRDITVVLFDLRLECLSRLRKKKKKKTWSTVFFHPLTFLQSSLFDIKVPLGAFLLSLDNNFVG